MASSLATTPRSFTSTCSTARASPPTELRTLEFVLNGGGGKYEYNVSEDAKAFLAETIAAEKAKADADAGAR